MESAGEPAGEMGRRFAAQMGAPLTAQSIEIATLEIRHDRQNVPLMIDGDARMTELAAICQHLAERYSEPPLSVRPDEPGYGAYLNGLHFGEATLTFPQALMLALSRRRQLVQSSKAR